MPIVCTTQLSSVFAWRYVLANSRGTPMELTLLAMCIRYNQHGELDTLLSTYYGCTHKIILVPSRFQPYMISEWRNVFHVRINDPTTPSGAFTLYETDPDLFDSRDHAELAEAAKIAQTLPSPRMLQKIFRSSGGFGITEAQMHAWDVFCESIYEYTEYDLVAEARIYQEFQHMRAVISR